MADNAYQESGSGTSDPVIYRIDANDRITWVNPAWSRFAIDNGAPELSGDMMGKPLFSFITGSEVAALHAALLKKVREGRGPVDVPFRCDAPDRRRCMRMHIALLPEQSVEYRCETLHEESRPPLALLQRPGMIRLCSWCKRVEVEGHWHEPEDAITELGLFEGNELPGVTHTICGDCYHSLMSETDDGGGDDRAP
jgi:hypothetical protein